MSRSTFSIQFYCRESKQNKKGLAHIELSIILNQKRCFINLPLQVKPSSFNSKRPPVEITDYCDNMRSRVNQILNDMLRYGEPMTLERLREYIKTGGYKTFTVNDLFNEYLGVLKERIGKSLTANVYRKYTLVYKQFVGLFDGDKEASTINNYQINTYYNELRKKYESSTTAGYMTKLKTFIQYGIDNGYLKTNPFSTIKITKERKPIVYLTREEQEKLVNAQLENNSLQKVLDCFLFELNSGISYADMLTIEKEDVKELNGSYYIQKKRQKTGTEYTAVLLPKAVDILRKYEYRLPTISNQKTNAYLKVIQNILGIKTLMTTHIARHTYLTNLLNMGVRMETVSRCAGHSSVKITESFYAHLENNTIVDEVVSRL